MRRKDATSAPNINYVLKTKMTLTSKHTEHKERISVYIYIDRTITLRERFGAPSLISVLLKTTFQTI